MSKLIRVSAKTCQKCKYRMGFGSQPGKEQKEKGQCMNVACNYLGIERHSRIFEDGKMAYDPKFCDKFKKGDVTDPEEEYETTFPIRSLRSRKSKEYLVNEWKARKEWLL